MGVILCVSGNLVTFVNLLQLWHKKHKPFFAIFFSLQGHQVSIMIAT